MIGLAQLRSLRWEADLEESMRLRVKHDIEYLRSWSLLLDLAIILQSASRAACIKMAGFPRAHLQKAGELRAGTCGRWPPRSLACLKGLCRPLCCRSCVAGSGIWTRI
jgi:hypothetical protein